MEIPTPDEFAKAGGYNPFPGKWNRWLSAVREGILSAQPKAGRHVTIDEHPGKGTVINIDDTSARRGGGGPPPTCPSSVIVTLHNVVMDCGCVSNGPTASILNTDDGFLNENPFPLVSSPDPNLCPDVAACFLDDYDCSTFGYKAEFFNSSTNCSGSPDFTFDPLNPCNTYLLLISGTWHLLIRTAPSEGTAVIFYGTTSDLALPITNTVSCLSSAQYITECPLPDGSNFFTGIAHGGTATITIP